MHNHNTNEALLVTADTAAQLLSIGRSTLYRLVRARRLPVVRLGIGRRNIWFSKAALADWIREQSMTTGEDTNHAPHR